MAGRYRRSRTQSGSGNFCQQRGRSRALRARIISSDPCDPADGPIDSDGDGFSNAEEWIADTNPNLLSAHIIITDKAVESGGHRVFFPARTGRLYTIQTTTDLENGPWTDVPGMIDLPGTTGIQTILDPLGSAERYYRVWVRLP